MEKMESGRWQVIMASNNRHKNLTIRGGLSFEETPLPIWFHDAKTENAEISLDENGKFTWHTGIWLLGDWYGDIWCCGLWNWGYWKRGTWKAGRWYDGYWKNGTWENGIWHDGTWKDGTWINGTWFEGKWIAGTFVRGTHGYDKPLYGFTPEGKMIL
jgi:hypothetical protein